MKWILGAALGMFMVGASHAANYAVQDGGAASGCPNAWPPSIVGNYNENGTLNGAPRYDGNGWYLYRTDIFGATSWVVSNNLGSNDVNNSTVAFYTSSNSATPPSGTGYSNTNSACGKINVQPGVVVPPPSTPNMGPLNAGVQPYISGGSTNVAWMGVAGVVGYKLDVATDPGFTVFHPGYNALVVTGSPTPPTSVTVTGLNNAGTTYYFRVRSYNGGGDSANSATVSTTTAPTTPAMQAAATVRAQRFTANWSASTGATSHRLQVCTDAGFTSCVASYNPATVGNTPSALVTGLSQNTTYHYRVAAGNDNGYSSYSGGATVTTNALPTLGGTFTTNGAVNDNATIAPFSGVTVADANGDPITVATTYTAANGTLSGTGLTGSAGSYTLTAATPAAATSALQALVFHPTYAQGPTGSTVNTTFTLQPSDGIDAGAANSSTVVTTTMTNAVPVFVGVTTSINVNGNSSGNDVTGLLHVSDPDVGQTMTWSQHTAPAHGSLQVNGTSTASGGSDIAPVGTVAYTPAAGYAGSDSFAIQVNDGFGTAVRTLTVTVQPVAPGAPTIGTATAGEAQASVTFTAPASNGGSAITTYTATSNPTGVTGSCAGPAACTITVSPLNNGTAYTFTVTATNAIGTSTASGTSNAVTPKANQTITFADPGTPAFATSPTLSATASSTLTVTFTSSTPGVCTITGAGVLTFVTAGTCTINADQSGNASTNAAPTVSRSFNVTATVPGAPTMGTATAGSGQASVSFTAPASNGGASVTSYTIVANPGGASGNGASSPITVTSLTNGVAYTFTVTATNSVGTGPASFASNSITPKALQTITFNNPGSQNFGTTPTIPASSSAGGGYPVSLTSATPWVCTITTGGTLTFVTAGSCTINANQPGDGSFLAAPQISQTFTVNAVVPGAPTSATATAGDTQASVSFTAPVSIGGATITSYTVTVNPAHVAPVNGAGSPMVVTGLTNGVAYTFTMTATNSAGTGSASAASNSITPAASQTINFANPGAQNFGTTPTLTATSDSGLTPVFTSSTQGVCTITGGGALTFVTAGTCTINADQAGNGSYLPATQVSRSFAVNAVVPGAPTIGTASADNVQATVTFTAPASAGGATIAGYTVTANPGGATAAGAASPITLAGLTNGTSYTFTVAATNAIGTGSPSAASNSVIPRLLAVTGTPPGMAGAATATLSGGGPTCTLDPTSGFAGLSNPAPAGKTMQHGEYAFQATACTGTVTMAITYPHALPAGVQFWKYGPPTAAVGGVAAASTWFQLSGVTLSADRLTVTYTITDNGVGDSDATPGRISDPFALAAGPVGGGAVAIPVDAPWALGLLSVVLGFLGWRRQRGLAKG